VDIVPGSFAIENLHTAVERVHVAANLRHHNTEILDQAFAAGRIPEEIPYAQELHLLWRFALSLEAARGKSSNQVERPEYAFHVEGERITISARRRGEPMDKLVAELMVLVNSTWGKMLDDNDVPAVYRAQANGKVRMTTGAAAHQGLGVSHYAWSSSPLRRYIDLINQWQLLALVAGDSAPFRKNSAELLSAVSDFEATYAAYADFQRHMEFYWCLRWLLQEKVDLLTGEVLRENLVRIDQLPLVVRVPSLPETVPGTRVELEVGNIDLLEASLRCQFRRALEAAIVT
jgi:exoribonuclease-2